MRTKQRFQKIIFVIFSILLLAGCQKEPAKTATVTPETSEKSEKSTIAVAETSEEPTFNPNNHADYPHWDSLASIVETSTDVVRAEIVEDKGVQQLTFNNRFIPGDTFDLPYRIYTLKVTQPLKGSLKADATFDIKVDQMEYAKELTQDGIYFLKLHEDSPASLLNPYQGNLPIVSDQIALDKDTLALFVDDNPERQEALEQVEALQQNKDPKETKTYEIPTPIVLTAEDVLGQIETITKP